MVGVDPEVTVGDEYAIDARDFRRALIEQKSARVKGGLYHLTQIQMAYNSNRIEGSTLTEDQTRYLFETRTVTGDALLDDVVETENHFRAFDQMLEHVGEPITADTMKEYHRTLKSGTRQSHLDWFVVGGWKTIANAIGDVETTPPADVPGAIDELVRSTPERMTFEDIATYHQRFESIHPFQDGNGRAGRLIMFEQCLANDIMPFNVLDEQKAFYYRGLARYGDEPGWLLETLRSFQDDYYGRFSKYVPRRP